MTFDSILSTYHWKIMVDEKRNSSLLWWLVHDISADILVKFLDKKLEIAQTYLQTFLQRERHTFYHLFQKNKCCACVANLGNSRTCMFPQQWNYLYSGSKPSCCSHGNCSCQYDAKASVRSSELDISLCSILLLNSGTLNLINSEICHIHRIRKHRNDLAHDTSSKIDNHTFELLWNDVTVSILQLARACSIDLAVQTETKIDLAKTPQECIRGMEMVCGAYPKCMDSPELTNERCLAVCTSVDAVQEAVMRMNECFTPMTQQTASYDITRIRGKLMTEEYKEFIISYMDANRVINFVKKKGLLSNSDAQYLLNLDGMRLRSEQMLQRILSKDDAVIDTFMHSLLDTQQNSIHDFIQGSDSRSKLCLILECDIPQPHPVGIDLSVHITLKDRVDLQSKVLDILRREADEINQLTMMFADLSLRDAKEGSIILRLRPESPDAVEKFYNAFLNGKLQELIEEILRRSGVLEELIRDQVTVVVNISIDGTKRQTSTFYERNWKHLVDELSPRPVAALLLERGVFTKADIQEIFHVDNLTRFSQSHSLIHKLNSKGYETVVDFKQCLSLTSQSYVLSDLKEFVASGENQLQQTTQNEIQSADHTGDQSATAKRRKKEPFKFHEGWIDRKIEGMSKWEELWLCLKGHDVFIFTHSNIHNEDTHIGRLPINSKTRFDKKSLDERKGYVFELYTIASDGRSLRHKFKTVKKFDMEMWRGYIMGLAKGALPSDLDLPMNMIEDMDMLLQQHAGVNPANKSNSVFPRTSIESFDSGRESITSPTRSMRSVTGNWSSDYSEGTNATFISNRSGESGGRVRRHKFSNNPHGDDTTPSWFFPNCSREFAHSIFKTKGCRYGDTLMRESSNNAANGDYVVTHCSEIQLNGEPKCDHYKVVRTAMGYKLYVENPHDEVRNLTDVMNLFVEINGQSRTNPMRTNDLDTLGLNLPDHGYSSYVPQGTVEEKFKKGVLSDAGLQKYVCQHLGRDWRELMSYLNVDNNEIQRIHQNSIRVEDAMFSCLMSWRNANSHRSTEDLQDVLMRELKECGRYDIVDKLEKAIAGEVTGAKADFREELNERLTAGMAKISVSSDQDYENMYEELPILPEEEDH